MKLRIKEAIKANGLTVKEVAERMGITPVGLSQHINGNPSVEVLERIAAAVGGFLCPSADEHDHLPDNETVAGRIDYLKSHLAEAAGASSSCRKQPKGYPKGTQRLHKGDSEVATR